jgi:hypothetical protein
MCNWLDENFIFLILGVNSTDTPMRPAPTTIKFEYRGFQVPFHQSQVPIPPESHPANTETQSV